jgi:hypothetical protein
MSALTDSLRVTVAGVLTEYGETLRVSAESAITYDDAGAATIAWTPPESAPSFTGAWFPADGNTARREVGMVTKSSVQVIAPHDVTVAEGNRVYRADNSWKYVNYVEPIGASGQVVAQTVYLHDAEGKQ